MQSRMTDELHLLLESAFQKELYEDISCAFKANKAISIDEKWAYKNSRFEVRKCSVLVAVSSLMENVFSEWVGLQTIIKLQASRTIKGQSITQVRYYIYK